MECYRNNRTRVFEIYGIDPKAQDYNCHHIVTREDLKLGLVPSNFDLNTKANLYPSLIKDHNEIHKRLYRLEPRSTTTEISSKNLTRLNINSTINFFIDPQIFEIIKRPEIKKRSTPLKFLVWKRQGVL